MGYMAYKGQKWIVRTTDFPNECPVGTNVTFSGGRTAVTVNCGSNQPYGQGRYMRSSNTIKMPNEYEISMTEGDPPTITFTLTRQSGLSTQDTGSWTAEDGGPWPGEGDD